MNYKLRLYFREYLQRIVNLGIGEKTVIDFFRNYTDSVLDNPKKFVKFSREFIDFVKRHECELFIYDQDYDETDFKKDLNKISSVVESLVNKSQNINRNNFIKLVEYFSNPTTKILDVGAGKFPYQSIILASRNRSVSAMDDFLVSDNYLKEQSVEPIRNFFKEQTDISSYDIVVGLKPCTAIADIVLACKKWNKPYFIHLCQCDAQSYAIKHYRSFVNRWEFILPSLDNDVKCLYGYATNLDIGKTALERVLNKKCKFNKELIDNKLFTIFNEAMSSEEQEK